MACGVFAYRGSVRVSTAPAQASAAEPAQV